jgi:prolipoprotein diacylglyceryltransferase
MLAFGIILLVWCSKQKHNPGDIGTTYILVYGLARSFIENYRGDLARGFIFGMSTSQFISIFFVTLGFGIKLWRYKQRKQEKFHKES